MGSRQSRFLQGDPGGAEDAGFVAELGRNDAEVLPEGGGETAVEGGLQRVEEDRAGLGDSAADHNEIGVEQVAAVDEAAGEFPGDVFPEGEGDGIACGGGLGEGGGLAVCFGACLSGVGVGEDGVGRAGTIPGCPRSVRPENVRR